MRQTQYNPPELWRRAAAMVYDTLLVAALSILYGALVTSLHGVFYGAPAMGERIHWGAAQPLMLMGWAAFICGFFCYFWHNSGQTLGMKTWRLRITTPDLQLPSYKQCVLRCLLAPISFVCLGAGYWWLYAHPQRQTLHDTISGTRTWLTPKQ